MISTNNTINQIKEKKDYYSIGILIWFIIMIFGPYFPFMGTLLRVDHFAFPTLGTALLVYFAVKEKQIIIPSVLYIFIGFIFVALFATFFAVRKPEFFLLPVPLLSSLDNHLRIGLIFLLAAYITKNHKIDVNMIIKGVVISAAIIGVMGVFQVIQKPAFFHDFVEKITIDFYTGRHNKSKRGIPQLLCHIRAMGTFYLPGNYALFCSMALSFILIVSKIFKKYFVFYIVLFLITLGLFFSGSKGMFAGFGVILAYVMFAKRWKNVFQLFSVIVLSFLISSIFCPHMLDIHNSYFKHKNFHVIYNKLLGPRYGFFVDPDSKGKGRRSVSRLGKQRRKEKELMQRKNKNLVEEDKTKEGVQVTDKQDLKNIEAPNNNNIDEKQLVFDSAEGNLFDAFKIVSKNKLIGVGYSSNVDFGDSMILHLLVRGGVLGTLLFFGFVITLMWHIYKNNSHFNSSSYAIAWIVSAVIFLIGGIAYPSFIQDRTGDIFWCLGAILLLNKNNDQVIK